MLDEEAAASSLKQKKTLKHKDNIMTIYTETLVATEFRPETLTAQVKRSLVDVTLESHFEWEALPKFANIYEVDMWKAIELEKLEKYASENGFYAMTCFADYDEEYGSWSEINGEMTYTCDHGYLIENNGHIVDVETMERQPLIGYWDLERYMQRQVLEFNESL